MPTSTKPRCCLDWIPLELRREIYGQYLAISDYKLALWIEEPTATMINLEFDTRSACASKIIKPGENIRKAMLKDVLPGYPIRGPNNSTLLHSAMTINTRLFTELLEFQAENSVFLLTACEGLQAYPSTFLSSIRHLAIQTYPTPHESCREIRNLATRLLELCPTPGKMVTSKHSFTLPNLQTITICLHKFYSTAARGIIDHEYAAVVNGYRRQHPVSLFVGTPTTESWLLPGLQNFRKVGSTFAMAHKEFLAFHIWKDDFLLSKVYLQETVNKNVDS
ncbi:hypothetical protein BJ875DRAFT_490341 [Amylocarpus encephaloides]|uniref:Uncharacterized protein n=1 Tax=Amylocarpus encephaloides TaxID=45428 RepID=A0A9P7Y5Y2_9HELO|nr:hypothetical protein BJ875DRAFT_490341 [Amylocarpus encephaloides]